MVGKFAAELLVSGIAAIKSQASSEGNKIGLIFKNIVSHPVKVIASFITAPILVFRIASLVENKIRRNLAIAGLLLSLVASYACATFIGTFFGALFVASHIGFLSGVGVLIGLSSSVYLSVIFSIISFNTVSFIFLKVSTQEVVDYLNEISS